MSDNKNRNKNRIIDVAALAALCAIILYCIVYVRDNWEEPARSEGYHVSIQEQESDMAGQTEQETDPYDNDYLPIGVTAWCDGWTKEISLYVSEGTCYAFLPAYAQPSRLAYVYDETEYDVALSGQVLASGELLADIETDAEYEIRITDKDQNVMDYTMVFLQSQYLPAVFIDTKSGSMDYVDAYKGNEEPGQFSCVTADGEIDSQASMNRIKGRGNTSWEGSGGKNQYNVQLADSTDVLHMGSAQNWIIQSNKLDASMMRNKLAYDFAKDIGMPYAVDSEFADMYLNGRYMGTYLVCEKVEVAPNRIDIGNGYLLEVNFRAKQYSDGKPYFTASQETLIINSPDPVSEEEINEITDYVGKAADYITRAEQSDEYLDYIDLNSFAKLYIIDELGDDPDNNALSTFYYKEDTDDAKLTAGPVWDFDISFGNDERSGAMLCSYYSEEWFEYLYKNRTFREEVARLLRDIMENSYDKYADHYFEDMEEYLRESYHMNGLRWKEKQGYIASYYSGCEDNMAYLNEYFMTRLNNLNRAFNGSGVMHKVEFLDRGHQYAHTFVADGETIPVEVWDSLQRIDQVESWRLPTEQLINPYTFVVYDDVQIGRKSKVKLAGETQEDTVTDNGQNTNKGELAMQWISFIMLMVPGLISVWISGNTKMSKENAFAVLSQYLLNSFIVLLLAYGIFFVLYGSALLSFSDVYNAAYDYSIFNVNVAFKYLLLAGVLSVAVGIAERIIFTTVRKRKVTEK